MTHYASYISYFITFHAFIDVLLYALYVKYNAFIHKYAHLPPSVAFKLNAHFICIRVFWNTLYYLYDNMMHVWRVIFNTNVDNELTVRSVLSFIMEIIKFFFLFLKELGLRMTFNLSSHRARFHCTKTDATIAEIVYITFYNMSCTYYPCCLGQYGYAETCRLNIVPTTVIWNVPRGKLYRADRWLPCTYLLCEPWAPKTYK